MSEKIRALLMGQHGFDTSIGAQATAIFNERCGQRGMTATEITLIWTGPWEDALADPRTDFNALRDLNLEEDPQLDVWLYEATGRA